LARALEARAMKDDILIGDTPKAKRRKGRLKGMTSAGRLWKHSTLLDVYGLVNQAQIDDYFCFTLVRNPWDRMVSYYHWLRDQNFDHPAVGLAKSRGFSDFINHAQTVTTVRRNAYVSYMLDESGKDAANAYIRLEHLKADLEPLQKHLGFALGEIPVENRSARREAYQSYYTAQDAALIAEICGPDIDQFGYRFEP